MEVGYGSETNWIENESVTPNFFRFATKQKNQLDNLSCSFSWTTGGIYLEAWLVSFILKGAKVPALGCLNFPAKTVRVSLLPTGGAWTTTLIRKPLLSDSAEGL